ncbi:hypothetical protein HZS_1648 [Henneguya salminicola]|nr:hypothetical protein HZS_1648 [Henneguya salminicola]
MEDSRSSICLLHRLSDCLLLYRGQYCVVGSDIIGVGDGAISSFCKGIQSWLQIDQFFVHPQYFLF